ncbi:MAG: serine hydrolase domain-containing protein [Candidatus Aminicenantaceae bacterium]|jgi:CubicO group peptidase (beta-lactamase class C family)
MDRLKSLNKRFLKLSFRVLILFLILSLGLAQPLPKAKPEKVGMSSERLNRVEAIIQEAIERKDFPGAVLLVGRKGKIVFHRSFGESQWIPESRPMSTSMIFDLASITKPVATATSIMILVEQGKIRLWDKVKDYIPEFKPYVSNVGQTLEGESEPEDVRLWHLLTHTSGLPPYTDAEEVAQRFGDRVSTETLVDHIAQLKKSDPPGKAFHYSCLGFISLAYIINKVTGQTVAEFASENIFVPLKMSQTFFVPSPEFHYLCVPTEVEDGKPLIGIVHDPLARLQGGISGNAGLFSTAGDLAIFAQMILNKGELMGKRILGPLAVERMTSVYPEVAFAGRGLGWDLDSSYSTNGGDLFGPDSFGHTGYTGTSIWIDPETETFVIFLTNRVHPSDEGSVVSMRSCVANIVASSIIE